MRSDESVRPGIRASWPAFRNQNDKVSFVVHVSSLAVLTATGSQAPSDTAFPTPPMTSVGDYAGEDGDINYSQQFKNLEKLVKRIDEDSFSKLDGSTNAGSSSNPQSSKTGDRTRQEIYEPVARLSEPAGPPNHPAGIIFPPVPIGPSSFLVPRPAVGVYPPLYMFRPAA